MQIGKERQTARHLRDTHRQNEYPLSYAMRTLRASDSSGGRIISVVHWRITAESSRFPNAGPGQQAELPGRNGDLGDGGVGDLAGEQRANQRRDDAGRPLSQDAVWITLFGGVCT